MVTTLLHSITSTGMNYRVNFDRSYSHISRTEDEADDEEVFYALGKAKEALTKYTREEIKGFRALMNRIKALKVDDVEIE